MQPSTSDKQYLDSLPSIISSQRTITCFSPAWTRVDFTIIVASQTMRSSINDTLMHDYIATRFYAYIYTPPPPRHVDLFRDHLWDLPEDEEVWVMDYIA